MRCTPARALLVAASLLLSWTAGPARAQPTPDAERAVHALLAAAEVPGVSVATVEGGAVAWTGTFGQADVARGEAVGPGTVFEAASLSKPVTAYVALRLADRGALDLDAPLWDLLPYERLAHDERARRLTARMVLTHRSGLPNWGGTPLRFVAPPDSAWGYSGEGFVYLQRALEAATGLGLDDLARREVFEPLGMTHSGFVWRDAWRPATGYDDLGEPRVLNRQAEANGAAGLVTTAADYARFLAAVLRGAGLAPATHRAALAHRTDVPPAAFSSDAPPSGPAAHVGWGLGWGVTEGDGHRSIWHWGDNGAFRAFAIGDPETGDGVVYLTNSENGLSMVEDLVAAVAPGSALAGQAAWAARWLAYQRYDDPDRRARRRLYRAFLDGDPEAGFRVYDELAPDRDLTDAVHAAARLLADRGRTDEALAVARRGVETAPTSAAAWSSLGEVQTATGHHEDALASYEQALALDHGMADDLVPRMDWLREGLGDPVPLPDAALRALAGTYGERQLVYRDGTLYYTRAGSTTETPLTPLGDGLFRLASSTTFRLRIVTDAAGRPVALEGRYADGYRDTSPRTD